MGQSFIQMILDFYGSSRLLIQKSEDREFVHPFYYDQRGLASIWFR